MAELAHAADSKSDPGRPTPSSDAELTLEMPAEGSHPSRIIQPIDGGNDAGMDGVGELPDTERFFLVSTVAEDRRANLERNVRSYIKAGGDRRTVVFATTRKVSGQRRIQLARHLEREFGVRLAEVHDWANSIQLLLRKFPLAERTPRRPGSSEGLYPGRPRIEGRLPRSR